MYQSLYQAKVSLRNFVSFNQQVLIIITLRSLIKIFSLCILHNALRNFARFQSINF